TPTRSIRIGPIWDQARTIAELRGTTITAVIEHALEDYAMGTTEIPPLSDGTRAAVANLVDYTIEREYGNDVTDEIKGATMVALAGLHFDLLDAGAADAEGTRGLAETTLRILLRTGLAARICQCRQLHPHGCKHGGAVGSLWCDRHYEADVPAIDGALLCGTCHVVEYEARA
ncbi:hypothetical protein C1I95_32125, partial [Micromonospora craterilacus]